MAINDDVPCKSIPDIIYIIVFASLITCLAEHFVMKNGVAEFILNWGLVPARLLENIDIHNVLTLFTHPFIHYLCPQYVMADRQTHSVVEYYWLQLAITFTFLFIFGDNIEDRMGSLRFLIFCVVSDLIASFTQIFYVPSMEMPIIGLSNLVSAILGAFVVSYPDAKLVTTHVLGRQQSYSFSARGIIILWFLWRTAPLFMPFLNSYILHPFMHLISPLASNYSIGYILGSDLSTAEIMTPDCFGDLAGFAAGMLFVKLLEKKDLNSTSIK